MQVYYPSDTTIELEFFRGLTIPRYRAWRWFYVIAGGCYQLTRKLSFGAAANFTLNFNSSPLNLDVTALAKILGINLGGGTKDLNPAFKIDVLLKQSYELGGLYRPTKWLNIGAFYRYKLGNEFNIPIKIPPGLSPEETNILISGYMYVINPSQWSFGAAVFPTKKLTLAFDMQYDEWSKITPGIKITSDSPSFNTPKEDFKLKDVWWPKFGIEWKDRAGGKYSRMDYAIRLGYSYYPSPYPSKVPLSKNIDNDAHYFSGGFSIGYKPRRNLDYISLDYFYQYVDLVGRKYEDITQNPSTIVTDGHVIYTGFGFTMMM
jgi:long-subunit fatty acid transport protein